MEIDVGVKDDRLLAIAQERKLRTRCITFARATIEGVARTFGAARNIAACNGGAMVTKVTLPWRCRRMRWAWGRRVETLLTLLKLRLLGLTLLKATTRVVILGRLAGIEFPVHRAKCAIVVAGMPLP